jgi:hypothetical protein
MSDDSSARRPGRPPLADDDPSVPVHLKLPSREYDEAYRRAQREGVSVPEIIRRELRQEFRNPK